MRLLYPSSLLNPFQVDEHFQAEADASAEWVGLHDTANNRVLRISEGETYLYRGWILTPDAYAQMESLVTQAGASLIVSCDDYVKSQFAENWLPHFQDHTATTMSVSYNTDVSAVTIPEGLFPDDARFFVKGSSKSAKHNLHASYAASAEDLPNTLTAFKEEVSSEHEHLILIREFEDYVEGETRTWWIDGMLASVQRHPQSSVEMILSEPLIAYLTDLETAVRALNTPFVTVDLRQTVSGAYRVIEVGDGQVSESSVPLEEVLTATSFSSLIS